ncbi:hypothetical protein M4D55_04525 [Metabacillus idriensis]|uniref:hypothetical protein n=1 Tax=Metabacillus idriensis TaxID=324768 RepID=UPI00203F7662|nr:hypothetical protein [Metabacillus idriensis]MCM3595048.1 hypothetical protein [Metabacillus idriensis]
MKNTLKNAHKKCQNMLLLTYIYKEKELFMKNLLFSPFVRALVTLITAFGSGILCSSVVTDITVEGKLDFTLLPTSKVFWFTGAFIIALLFYYVPMTKRDMVTNEILSKYEDQELLSSYYKGQHKGLVRLAKKELKLGNLDKLEDINKYANGVFGNEPTTNDDASKKQDTGAR